MSANWTHEELIIITTRLLRLLAFWDFQAIIFSSQLVRGVGLKVVASAVVRRPPSTSVRGKCIPAIYTDMAHVCRDFERRYQ